MQIWFLLIFVWPKETQEPRTGCSFYLAECDVCILDTIQDFLRKLGMKPQMHLVEISIFSLNHVIVRPTKIIKDLREASK